jgi:hypothetical protein
LQDLLSAEAAVESGEIPGDVDEVVNYVKAMNRGLARLETLPVSVRLIREIHQDLLHGVRGSHLTPGEFRRSQNWIGPGGSSLADATFVPPPPTTCLARSRISKRFARRRQHAAPHQDRARHAQFRTIIRSSMATAVAAGSRSRFSCASDER